MSTPKLPGPTPTPVTRHFWDAARAGRLELRCCRACGLMFHYPRVLCPRCWSQDLGWHAVSGRGTVATFTVLHRAVHPAWQARAPYVAALVDLEEGPRLLSNIVGADPAAVRVGLPVEVVFEAVGDAVLPRFAPRP
jgi:uncharacterized OB-fold protein